MIVTLRLRNHSAGLSRVTVEMRVDDQSALDGPARAISAHRADRVEVAADGRITLDLPAPPAPAEQPLCLNVRVSGEDRNGAIERFINTSEVRLPSSEQKDFIVDLFPY